jgi:predicted O-linked N-acetylglucosamine transferase (SPINDLY family)
LYRLPHSLWCYRPLAAQARVPQYPPLMRNGYITFGSVNNVVKVSPETITAWARILQALPGSRLVMTSVPDGAVRQMLGRSISDHGIAPERVRMHDRLPHANYWQLLRQIDIALDPFPYAGTTTTCETLWMGVPVVTLIGETSVARSGFALLQCVGLAELAAADPADYVSRAVALANDPERLTRLHQELPARFDASALRDEAGLARDIETAFRKMWRTWCQTQQGQGGVNCRSCPDADAAHDLDLAPAVQLVVL